MMEIPSSRIFRILGLAKATTEKKAAAGEMIAGRGGQSAIGMVKLLGIAERIVADSTADAARWLGRWIERPQPALGGREPADLLDTPTGVQVGCSARSRAAPTSEALADRRRDA